AWQLILEKDALWNLEVKQQLFIWLFDFLSIHPFVPASVYKLMMEYFYWNESHNILRQNFNQEKIEKTLHTIERAPWSLLFTDITFPDDFDINAIEHYLSQRDYLDYLITCNEAEKTTALLDEMHYREVKDPEKNRLLINFYLNNGHTAQALEYCQQLINEHPENIDGPLQKANILFAQKKHAEAAYAFRAVLKIDNKHALAIRGLAACSIKTGNLLAAKKHYEQAVEALPLDIEARIQLIKISHTLIQQSAEKLKTLYYSGKHRRTVAEGYLTTGDYYSCISFIGSCTSDTSYKGLGTYTENLDLDEASIEEVQQALAEEAGILEAFKKAKPLPDPSGRMIQRVLANRKDTFFNYLSYDLHILSAQAHNSNNYSEKAILSYQHAFLIAEAEGNKGYEALIELGRLHIERKAYSEALDILLRLDTLAPDNAEILHHISEAYRFLEDFENALLYSNKSIDLDNSHWVYFSARSMILIELEKYRQAIEDLDITLDSTPNFAWAWHRKGICLSKTLRHEKAIECFESAIAYDTGFSLPCFEIARSACALLDTQRAISAIEEYINRGYDVSKLHRIQNEITTILDKALNDRSTEQKNDIYNDYYHFYIHLAEIFDRAEKGEWAELACTQALNIADTTNTNAHLALSQQGAILINNEKYNDALNSLNSANTLNPANAVILNRLSNAQRYLEDYKVALENSNQAISIDDTQWLYFSTRSLILLELEKYPEASNDLDIVLENRPEFAWAWYRKGLCMSRTEQHQQAAKCFETALSFNDSLKPPRLELIRSACALTNREMAVKNMQIYIKDHGEDPSLEHWQEKIKEMHNEP
ncbi:hypothetical protein MNBD_GAMMA10-224, partial [hydrothermal vent metagenome]